MIQCLGYIVKTSGVLGIYSHTLPQILTITVQYKVKSIFNHFSVNYNVKMYMCPQQHTNYGMILIARIISGNNSYKNQ